MRHAPSHPCHCSYSKLFATTWSGSAQSVADSRVWAVVKANAYGHGIERAFEGLRGADGFALLDLNEAERVRALGWRGPVLLLEGVFDAAGPGTGARAWGCGIPCIASEQIDWLSPAQDRGPHRVFLKMNTGMNRLGFATSKLPHCLDAPERPAPGGRDFFDYPLQRRRWPQGHRRAGRGVSGRTADLPGERSLCNSAATLRHAHDPASPR
jgi:alanine racemase